MTDNNHIITRMDENCKEPFPRESCIQCALKHTSQARVLLIEAKQDYKLHAWYAMGHLAEAEAELIADHKIMADMIRAERIKLQSDLTYEIDFESVLLTLIEYDDTLAVEILEGLDA